jgi:hypothetical protein
MPYSRLTWASCSRSVAIFSTWQWAPWGHRPTGSSQSIQPVASNVAARIETMVSAGIYASSAG